MGHDGPGHVAIAQEPPDAARAASSTTASAAPGLSVEFKVRYGPVTIVGCTQTADGRLKLIVAEGESIPGETFRIGNTNSPPALRARRPPSSSSAGAREGPTHHVALGVGHRRRRGAAGRLAARPRVRRGGLMERVCFLLRVRPDRLDEYQARHRAGVAGDARRAARDRLAQLLAVPARRRPARRLPGDRRLRGRAARDGGDRRQRALAGRDGAVLRAAASGRTPARCAWRRSSTLPDAPRYAAVDLGAESGRVVARRAARRPRRARGGPPLPQPAGAPARRPALEPAAPVHGDRSTGCARAAAGSPASASTPGASTTRCSTAAAACSACPSTTATRAPTGMVARAFERVPREELYAATGIQTMPINTVFQLLADEGSAALAAADADRARPRPVRPLAHRRAGQRVAPRPRTTGLLDARTGAWARALIERLGLPAAPVRRAGRAGHDARPAARPPTALDGAPLVHAVAGHDTASAFAAAPVRRRATPRSSRAGTWSLLGLELRRAGARRRGRATRTSPTSAASTARRGC